MAHIRGSDIRKGAIGSAALATGSVGSAAIATGAVTSDELAADSVTMAKLADAVLQESVVTLTNAEMLALQATPKTLVAAPGAGKALILHDVVLDTTPSGGAYTESTDNLAVKYTNGSGATASGIIETTGVIDGTSRALSFAPAIAVIPVVNAALVLHNTGDGEFGGGNAANTTSVRIRFYQIG